ncbi:hypothetical protein FQN57_003939 [Myotisia sp. PD_48]|nr:hypothetical protein FQN57_003939 [Myotisia sp. PD_48]
MPAILDLPQYSHLRVRLPLPPTIQPSSSALKELTNGAQYRLPTSTPPNVLSPRPEQYPSLTLREDMEPTTVLSSHPRHDGASYSHGGGRSTANWTAYKQPYSNSSSSQHNAQQDLQQPSRQKQPCQQLVSLTSQYTNHSSRSSPNPLPKGAKSSTSSLKISSSESKINLAEFAAQIACLFWFSKGSKLKLIEDSSSSSSPFAIPPLDQDSSPSTGFKKWVTTVLTTTQVSRNVILLALLFIYRLKKFNPTVRGKHGSEFRLMTIALMMGNKFLDDNTYTNKTWAEVSGISVQEIHVMEVEFLSNVRYNLFVTADEWTQWENKLSLFANYFEKASRLVLELSPPSSFQSSPNQSPLTPSTDSYRHNQVSTLPSPISSQYSNSSQRAIPVGNVPQAVGPRNYNIQPTTIPLEPLIASRKRGLPADQLEEHPAKRQIPATNPYIQAPHQSFSKPALVSQPIPIPMVAPIVNPGLQLPIPNPGYNHPTGASTSGTPSIQHPSTTSILPSLPNLYPAASLPSWNPTTVPQVPMMPLPSVTHQPPPTSNSFPGLSRRPSPYPISTSTTISPALSAYSVHTPTRLSPSSILLDRNSPYRPVRNVNTLLYPPPSGSTLQPRQLSVELMRYLPLGKRATEDRTGVLPYSQPSWREQYQPQTRSNTTSASGLYYVNHAQ